MKLTRGAFRTFLDGAFKTVEAGETARSWYLIGKDIEEMTTDLNPSVETKQNILDETSTVDNGYEPSMSADPYYADPEDALYPKLLDIALNRKTGDACKTTMLEVVIEDTEASSHKAWIENVYIKPTSYGGDTSGFQIPFEIHPNGSRTEGTVTITGGVPTFTKKA